MPIEEAIAWIVGLFALAIAFGIWEILTPFFGPSLMAVGCLIAATVIGFQSDPRLGWGSLAVSVVSVPMCFFAYMWLLANTRFGQAFIPPRPPAGAGDGIPDLAILESLVGRIGQTRGPLRPVGSVDFDGRRFDCQAESGYIDSGQSVRVLRVEGQRVVVRPA